MVDPSLVVIHEVHMVVLVVQLQLGIGSSWPDYIRYVLNCLLSSVYTGCYILAVCTTTCDVYSFAGYSTYCDT